MISCNLENLYPAILESKELTIAIMQLLSSTNDHLTNQVKKAYFYNRHEKIAAFLLEQKKKTISYTRQEIASLTGLNRVTVTRILNDFYAEAPDRPSLVAEGGIVVDHDELSRYLDKYTIFKQFRNFPFDNKKYHTLLISLKYVLIARQTAP